jgi:hypothetical protein
MMNSVLEQGFFDRCLGFQKKLFFSINKEANDLLGKVRIPLCIMDISALLVDVIFN